MAWDESLLDFVSAVGQPVLRFYGWTEPAATFGYFQKFSEVERMTPLRPLIRRPTGGGLVPHDRDWTYSFAVPPNDPWYALKALDSYRRMHEWICTAFAKIQVAVELSRCCRKESPGQCFAGAEQFDVVVGNQKIAGAAQRRTKSGLLVQGSIQPPAGVERERFQSAMCRVTSRMWNVHWLELKLSAQFRAHIQALAQSKYACDEFNRRR